MRHQCPMRHHSFWQQGAVLGTLLLLSIASLKAQSGAGIRGGVSVDPDQF